MDAISLSIFANRIDAICGEMGVTLQKSAFSPNIRDRLDYSCAIFDENGEQLHEPNNDTEVLLNKNDKKSYVEAYYQMARLNEANPANAITLYKACIDANPNFLPSYLALGRIYHTK